MSHRDSDPIPVSIPGYEIIKRLGRGAMAHVYLARQKSLDREVAIKVIKRVHEDSEDMTKRFQHEAETLAQIDHPNIVGVFDRGKVSGRHYFVMEYVEGNTLQDRMRDRSLTVREALDIFEAVGRALTAAHEAGIIHRDVKPSNVLMGKDGSIKLSDFGIAALTQAKLAENNPAHEISRELALSEVGFTIGTAMYMSPEQAMDASTASKLSDIYSFAVVVYEILTGKQRQWDSPPPSHRSLLASRRTDAVVDKGMAEDAEKRYDSAEELAARLKRSFRRRTRLMLDRPISTTVYRKEKWDKVIAVATAISVATFIAGGLLWLLRRG